VTAPAQPYIDLVTGTTHGTIDSGGSFSWYNSKAAGGSACSVSNVGTWCTASSYGPINAQASMSASVTSGIATGSYSWVCPCCEVGSPRAPIQGGHTKPTKK
jgi:hypothetical protein